MLNGTLCATQRTLCCLVENYQIETVREIRRYMVSIHLHKISVYLTGLIIPEVLRPYMRGREFLEFTRELLESFQKKV